METRAKKTELSIIQNGHGGCYWENENESAGEKITGLSETGVNCCIKVIEFLKIASLWVINSKTQPDLDPRLSGFDQNSNVVFHFQKSYKQIGFLRGKIIYHDNSQS